MDLRLDLKWVDLYLGGSSGSSNYSVVAAVLCMIIVNQT